MAKVGRGVEDVFGVIALDKFDREQAWLTKSSRHLGHQAVIIGHNLTDISKAIRTQCTQIYIFGCSRTDARDLIDEFDEDSIAECTKLEVFHFCRIISNRKAKERVSFGYVNPDTGEIFIQKSIDKPVKAG